MATRDAALDGRTRWPGIIAYFAGLGFNRFSLLQASAFFETLLEFSF